MKIVTACAAGFALLAAVLVNWNHLFPVPEDQVVEVVWTHECTCAHPWMRSLREEGFVVRDHEIDLLASTQRRWQIPEEARGCHPARYLGYALDGHVPAELLRRLARERPRGSVLVQTREADGTRHTEQPRFELHDAQGQRRAWP